MKKWNAPAIEELNLNKTENGGHDLVEEGCWGQYPNGADFPYTGYDATEKNS